MEIAKTTTKYFDDYAMLYLIHQPAYLTSSRGRGEKPETNIQMSWRPSKNLYTSLPFQMKLDYNTHMLKLKW